jgi:hypothetical protein
LRILILFINFQEGYPRPPLPGYARGGTRTPTVIPLEPKSSASAEFRHSRNAGASSDKFINFPPLSQLPQSCILLPPLFLRQNHAIFSTLFPGEMWGAFYAP